MISEESLSRHYAGCRVLVTGICGTVGREVLRQVMAMDPKLVVGIDNNESELFFLGQEYDGDPRVRLFLGDLRDRSSLVERFRNVEVVIHTAAFKHVGLCEHSPRDAMLTNIVGTQNVIDAATACGIQRVLFTSTDKAVNPTNVMGTSKLMGERLMTAGNVERRDGQPIFASTRFGNVLGSRGSVIPVFRQQIARGGPVRLTSSEMTRFIMTLEEAVLLVLQSVFLAQGGEVFVTKMPILRIEDLAHVMIEVLAPRHGYRPEEIAVELIGTRPGEKMYEELLNDEETRRVVETEKYFIILPATRPIDPGVGSAYPKVVGLGSPEPYNSSTREAMSRDELRAYLLRHRLLD